jgi:hypothetical protein
MRRAGNFNPEWGYLAPAPSFMRTARIVIVSAAVGATAGTAVVFSLVDRPAAEESVAARTLAQPVAAASTPISLPAAAQVQAPTQGQKQSPPPQVQADAQSALRGRSVMLSPANGRAESPAASESSTSSTAQDPASMAALAEVPAATDAAPAQAPDEMVTAPDAMPVQKKVTKKHVTWRSAPRAEQASSRGPLALLRSFTGRNTTAAHPPRGEY